MSTPGVRLRLICVKSPRNAAPCKGHLFSYALTGAVLVVDASFAGMRLCSRVSDVRTLSWARLLVTLRTRRTIPKVLLSNLAAIAGSPSRRTAFVPWDCRRFFIPTGIQRVAQRKSVERNGSLVAQWGGSGPVSFLLTCPALYPKLVMILRHLPDSRGRKSHGREG